MPRFRSFEGWKCGLVPASAETFQDAFALPQTITRSSLATRLSPWYRVRLLPECLANVSTNLLLILPAVCC